MKLTYEDEDHSYWLDVGDGKGKQRCKGGSRTAKVPDDTYNLEQWSDRMVALGMALKPDLIERAAAHYDDRRKLQAIAREAKDAAKAFQAMHAGTAAHAIVEKSDTGVPVISTEFSDAIVKGWNDALDAYGLEPTVGLSERIIVYPNLLIAGRIDTIRRRRRDGRLVIIDLKTGEKADRYPHSHSIQLGVYANAPLMAGPLSNGVEGWTEDFEPLPEDLDREVGYVVHMPKPGKAEVLPINIDAGFAMFMDHILDIYDWRARSDLILPREIPEAELEVMLLRSLPRFEWARDRRSALKDAGHGKALASAWSETCPEIPTFPKGGPRTEDELSKIVAVLDLVEGEVGMPFGAPDPSAPPGRPTQAKNRTQQRSKQSA